MAGACAFWGLMAPLGKDAMTHGMDGLDMVSFRVLGLAVLRFSHLLAIVLVFTGVGMVIYSQKRHKSN